MHTTPSPAPAPNATPAENALQARRLEEMIQAGMAIMQIVLQQARAAAQAAPDGAAPPGKPRDFTPAFARVTASIRQAMAMAEKLKKGTVAASQPVATPPAPRPPVPERARHRKLKRRVRSSLEVTIRNKAEGQEARRVLAALDARLNDPAFLIESGDDPIGVIVARLCDELNIRPDDRPSIEGGGDTKTPPKKIISSDFVYREAVARA